MTASIKRIGGGKGGLAIGAAGDYYDKSVQDDLQLSLGIEGAATVEADMPQQVAPGSVRFYHGGEDYAGGSRWLTEDLKYAQGYADKSPSGKLQYIDLPTDHPVLANVGKQFDDTGTSFRAPYVHFDAPPDVASKLRPVTDVSSSKPGPGAGRVVDEYLTKGAEGAAKPEWWSPGSTVVQDGAEIRKGEIRKLLDGTGLDDAQLVQGAKQNTRVGGWDITLSLPKPPSAMWATASPEMRAEIMQDLVQSARVAMQALHDRGVFETRRGKDGAMREVSADVAVALVPHVTNRDGQPQLHVHSVLTNIGRRQDGTTGALDPAKLYPWKTYAGAMFRTEFADRMAQRGLAITPDEQSFAIAGVPKSLTDQWSSRRATILAAMDKLQADLELGASAASAAATTPGVRQGPLRETDLSEAVRRGKQRREMLEEITRSTRQPSRPISGADLEASWKRDLSSLGLTSEGVWKSARDEAIHHQMPTQTAGDAALQEALSRSSIVTERTLRRLIAEHGQTRGGGAEAAHKTYDDLIKTGQVLQLAKTRRGELVMSTRETLKRERQMLLDAIERRGEDSLISEISSGSGDQGPADDFQ